MKLIFPLVDKDSGEVSAAKDALLASGTCY